VIEFEISPFKTCFASFFQY